MMRADKKRDVLIFIPNYLPGFKSGGILRTAVNTVECLAPHFNFWIVTRDRDLGDEAAYPGITLDTWHPVGSAMVRYLPPEKCGIRALAALAATTAHDVVHLNSFFDPVFTLRLLLARKFGWLPPTPVVLSPRGEFGHGSLRLKYPKKRLFIALAQLLGLHRGITWHASSTFERDDMEKVANVRRSAIRIAMDLPNSAGSSYAATSAPSEAHLRVVFLSRLSREKNLDYALRVLQRVKARVIFDIYGPVEDPLYWNDCRRLMDALPGNVTARYLGPVSPDEVAKVFAEYDLFFFPSSGENYGHVIAESLSVGTQVLISRNTPWKNLAAGGLGVDIDLADMDGFAQAIEEVAAHGADWHVNKRAHVQQAALRHLFDPKVIEDNIDLFRAVN
jgi:glycosyltransferase involved in cell wall biosynthesis